MVQWDGTERRMNNTSDYTQERRVRSDEERNMMLLGRLESMDNTLKAYKEAQDSFREENKAIIQAEYAKLENKLDASTAEMKSLIQEVVSDVNSLKEKGTYALKSIRNSNYKDHIMLHTKHKEFRQYVINTQANIKFELDNIKVHQKKSDERIDKLERAPTVKAASLWNTAKGKVILLIIAGASGLATYIGTIIFTALKEFFK